MKDAALHWFRRDLRLTDNRALRTALRDNGTVQCVFVFDTEILDGLSRRADRRVEFILHSLSELAADIQARGGRLFVLHGRAREEIPRLARQLGVGRVYANRDYEPEAIARDREVEQALNEEGIGFLRCKDQVVWEQDELVSQQGRAFTVFAAYRKAWLKRLPEVDLAPDDDSPGDGRLAAAPVPGVDAPSPALPGLEDLGFEPTNLLQLGIAPGVSGAERALQDFLPRMAAYREARNYPAVRGVSYLSVHLRFGTVSIRRLVDAALRDGSDGARAWLDELIWRDFYFSILYQFPYVVEHAFRRDLENLPFSNREDLYQAWQEGRTGYPLVDAAMRQLNQTGYMHNRLRMLTASFLVKDLHVDWRRGERYFAERLNDYDLAANNGGWQWSASTGNDAQPWFRIFNPVLQSKRFDPQGQFIRRYVPELAACSDLRIHEPWTMTPAEQRSIGVIVGQHYPAPVVDHAVARQETLRMFRGKDPG
jgi:deoxyribodipyrimidine photo-lyase